MTFQLLFILLLIENIVGWGYNGRYSPSHWCHLPEGKNQCCGNKQSPINIDTSSVVDASFSVIVKGMDNVWSYVNLTNERHTVSVRVPGNTSFTPPSVAIWYDYDKLSENYLLDSMHFHFGNRNYKGSEHQIDGEIFPMEMHSAFYNSKYPSFTAAKNYTDGIIVLATHFYISSFDNPKYKKLINGLKNIIYVNEVATINSGFKLGDLLPVDLSYTYSYQGSLTTPDCNQAVQWFIFAVRVPISEYQMRRFRALTVLDRHQAEVIANEIPKIDDIYMSNNFRPVQPINGRTVYFHKSYF